MKKKECFFEMDISMKGKYRATNPMAMECKESSFPIRDNKLCIGGNSTMDGGTARGSIGRGWLVLKGGGRVAILFEGFWRK